MKLLKSDIINLFRSDYAAPSDSFITDPDVMNYWWAALSRFYAEVDSEFTRSEATTHTIASNPEYALPRDLRAVIAVFNLQGTRWQRLIPFEYTEFLEMPQTGASGNASHYYVYSNQLGIYPTPSSSSLTSLLTGGWNTYVVSGGYGLYANTGSLDMGPTSQYVGKYMDVTAAETSDVQTFLIVAHTETAVTCLPVNTSTGGLGTTDDVITALTVPETYALTFEIWEYVEDVKVIYAQRPPIPGEDSARDADNLTAAADAETFEYYIPEEYLDTLLSFMLYKASRKDKLLKDAQSHKGDWELGLLKAQRSSGVRKDDVFMDTRSRGSFEYRGPQIYGTWWRHTHAWEN